MTAPDKIWAWGSTDETPVYCAKIEPSNRNGTSYTRADLAQAAVAAAYEAAAQVAIDRKGFESDAALVHPYDKGYVAACDAIATAIRALATPDQIAALASPDTITLSRAEVEALMEALMEAARAAWDEACANHEKAPPIKYLAPYGGLVRLHTALATLQERMK